MLCSTIATAKVGNDTLRTPKGTLTVYSSIAWLRSAGEIATGCLPRPQWTLAVNKAL